MSFQIFADRREAGQRLAEKLASYADRPDVLVLALPRGGVPVAHEVAQALGAPMDVFLVRKLGVPGYEELAMGAVASGGVRVLNDPIVRALGIPDSLIDRVAAEEQQELERRERLYRGGRPPPGVQGRTVILVDDGLATGATMQAAVKALKQEKPARLVVAVPTASPETADELRRQVDEVICVITPQPFDSVGRWYQDFSPTTDQEVRDLLEGRPPPAKASSPPADPDDAALEAVRALAIPLEGAAESYDPLLALVGDSRWVLLGEATHGTHEFYQARARITQRLIEEKGFTAVAVEADWPDAYRVNRYLRGLSEDADAVEALSDFQRFPTWMWRNTDVVEFLEWLRAHNDARGDGDPKTGFYGLDLYSLRASLKAVLRYLDQTDPATAQRARARYACFDHFAEDPQAYGFAAGLGLSSSCEDLVVNLLVDLERRAMEESRRDGGAVDEGLFDAVQNARVVKNAEAYYRSMYLAEISSWNLRDRHMVETLEALAGYLDRRGRPVKVVVWAHNSHLGDARATEMSLRGELNVGQLVRERHGTQAVLVGFSTHHGTVTAASQWDGPAERMRVRPSHPESFETVFHQARLGRFLLRFRGPDPAPEALRSRKLERAIGVIYRPDTERGSHYIDARLADQFDALLHFDETRAVEPLERAAGWEAPEVPQTFPFAV